MEYTKILESYIDQIMKDNVGDVSIQDIAIILNKHSNDVTSDVFEVIYSLTQFEEFKKLMLSYRNKIEMGSAITINSMLSTDLLVPNSA